MVTTTAASSDWRAEQLRLSAFTEAKAAPSRLVRDWWSALVGSPPEHVYEQPLAGLAGVVQLMGTYNDAPLHMKAERGRLDIIRPFNLAQPTPYTSPLLTETIAPFVDLATRWLNSGTPIRRLGLGCFVVRLFPEIEACRSALDAYLQPVDMQMTEPDSFEYRTNRRCSSQAVEGLTLNRIAKWSVDKVDVTGADSPVFMVRLETDLNSDADHVGALDHPVELFRELAGYAERIAREGDRP
jgi:hypothetical protein